MKKLLYIAPLAALLLSGCGQINSDEAGFKTSFGKVDTPVLDAGLYFVCPIGGELWKYTLRDVRGDVQMSSYTKDMQQADFKIAVVYAVDRSRLIDLHVKYGKDFANVIIGPAVAAAVKDVVGVWEADQLVNKRVEAAKAIRERMLAAVKDKPVLVKDLEILDIAYKDAFEKAIEAKQVAAQAALEAKNRTMQVEEEARQKIIQAKAEAEAIEIKAKALSSNREIVFLNLIEKWDGRAPNTLSVGQGANMFIPAK